MRRAPRQATLGSPCDRNGLGPRAVELSHALEPEDGLLRACADDIGTVLSALEHLLLVAPVFCMAEAASGLTLHFGKGVVVPKADGSSERMLRRARPGGCHRSCRSGRASASQTQAATWRFKV